MGILDDVVINAKTAAEAVGKKAGQIVDVSKLRFNVAELNAEISKRYEALGEYVYENCREALAEDAESVGKMAEIDELVNQRNILTKELVDKQNKVVCPSCGKQSPITASTRKKRNNHTAHTKRTAPGGPPFFCALQVVDFHLFQLFFLGAPLGRLGLPPLEFLPLPPLVAAHHEKGHQPRRQRRHRQQGDYPQEHACHNTHLKFLPSAFCTR